ncbi:uncharacterized protein PV07_06755 [Cladophialophora immunda]|uniref:MYND-type domain-containing protein n=1 Tax=Cladophialophora immunda TaxID=569365 RepID=A0A0D2APG0_9EURO|nr:uncharacterized protein PV07_06755 [Cladophialophora immunda]KIW26972.1 hypothetical protein PV07_06755 [Cladophialophora immunda]
MEDKPLTLEATCIMCPRRGLKICPNCKDARYCSKDCQKLDWKNHKIICPSFREPKPDVTEPNKRMNGIIDDIFPLRGLVNFRRALFFPGRDQPPRFVWVKTWIAYPGYEQWDKEEFFGESETERVFTAHNSIQARDACRDEDDTLILFFRQDATSHAPNLAVRAFTRAGTCANYFRGPIMLTRGFIDHSGNDHMRDVDMRDARNAADYFSSAYRQGIRDPCLANERFLATGVSGPELTTRSGRATKYLECVLDGCDSVFRAEGSGIANLLGIPILIRPYNPPKPKRNQFGFWIQEDNEDRSREENTAGPENVDVKFLLRDITSTTTGPQGTTAEMARFRTDDRDYAGENGFGSSPKPWNIKGPVWMTRADGVPLMREHVEALASYIRDEVEPRLSKALAGVASGGVVAGRETVLNSITPTDFSRYFDAFRAAKMRHDSCWEKAPSPYAMTKDVMADLKVMMHVMWEHLKKAGFKQQSDIDPGLRPGVLGLRP